MYPLRKIIGIFNEKNVCQDELLTPIGLARNNVCYRKSSHNFMFQAASVLLQLVIFKMSGNNDSWKRTFPKELPQSGF